MTCKPLYIYFLFIQACCILSSICFVLRKCCVLFHLFHCTKVVVSYLFSFYCAIFLLWYLVMFNFWLHIIGQSHKCLFKSSDITTFKEGTLLYRTKKSLWTMTLTVCSDLILESQCTAVMNYDWIYLGEYIYHSLN